MAEWDRESKWRVIKWNGTEPSYALWWLNSKNRLDMSWVTTDEEAKNVNNVLDIQATGGQLAVARMIVEMKRDIEELKMKTRDQQ